MFDLPHFLGREQDGKGQSWNDILDRSSQLLFMTEIFRGFWLTAEAMAKPKVFVILPKLFAQGISKPVVCGPARVFFSGDNQLSF